MICRFYPTMLWDISTCGKLRMERLLYRLTDMHLHSFYLQTVNFLLQQGEITGTRSVVEKKLTINVIFTFFNALMYF